MLPSANPPNLSQSEDCVVVSTTNGTKSLLRCTFNFISNCILVERFDAKRPKLDHVTLTPHRFLPNVQAVYVFLSLTPTFVYFCTRVPDSVSRQPKHLVRQTRADPKPVRSTGYAQTAALAAAGRQQYIASRNPWFYSQRVVRGTIRHLDICTI